MQDPFDVAVVAIEASNRGDWMLVVDLVDAEDLEQWYSGYTHMPDAPVRELTAQELKRHHPDMPDEVAEYQIKQFQKRVEEGRLSLHGQFAGIETRADLARLSPTEALARYLNAQDPDWQFEEQIKSMDPRLVQYARQAAWKPTRQPLGIVREGDEIAHVVYRVRWQGRDAEDAEGELRVASLRKVGAGWRLRLQGELFEHGGSVMFIESLEGEEE